MCIQSVAEVKAQNPVVVHLKEYEKKIFFGGGTGKKMWLSYSEFYTEFSVLVMFLSIVSPGVYLDETKTTFATGTKNSVH